MFPSEAEIEARLAALRRRREALDREMADLTLYRELGRRLGESGLGAETETGPETGSWAGSWAGSRAGSRAGPEPRPDPPDDPPARPPLSGAGPRPHPAPGEAALPPQPWAAPAPLRPSPGAAGPAPQLQVSQLPVPPVAFEDDPVAARRYGRAVIEAAIGVLEAAGRPLHAGEILERLAAQGFTLPGQDPVAALNTRLWKRSGPGGPVRRMGDAVYALADR
jgi:HB1, ASXL, restriction endonuclease HTH domain